MRSLFPFPSLSSSTSRRTPTSSRPVLKDHGRREVRHEAAPSLILLLRPLVGLAPQVHQHGTKYLSFYSLPHIRTLTLISSKHPRFLDTACSKSMIQESKLIFSKYNIDMLIALPSLAVHPTFHLINIDSIILIKLMRLNNLE